MKEIQRSLPRANQLADPITGKPAARFLTAVPVGLLPLLSDTSSSSSLESSRESSTATSPATSPPPTPSFTCDSSWFSPVPKPKEHAVPPPWHPPHLAHLLPPKPPPQRQKPTFAFLPLLDTPPASAASSPYPSNPSSRSSSPDPSESDQSQDPPTPSLTNASLDSSPPSRASSSSPEPPFLQLPPLRGKYGGESDNHPHFGSRDYYLSSHSDEQAYSRHEPSYDISFSMASMGIDGVRSSSYFPPPLSGTTAWNAFPDRSQKREPSTSPERPNILSDAKPIQRRNVMELNGVEIDIDDDDDDFASAASTPGASPPRHSGGSTPPYTGPTPSSPLCSGTCTPMPPSPNPDRGRELSPTSRTSSLPALSISPPNRCTKSLQSPVLFQRESGPRLAAI